MMTKTTAPVETDLPGDPWASAPASWTPLPGSRADRARAQSFLKPVLWEFIVRPEDRGLIAQLAFEVLKTEPTVGHAFGGRMLERLRARRDAARAMAERQRLHGLDVLLSRHLAALPDLLARARALR
jgi:hypothetical protein